MLFLNNWVNNKSVKINLAGTVHHILPKAGIRFVKLLNVLMLSAGKHNLLMLGLVGRWGLTMTRSDSGAKPGMRKRLSALNSCAGKLASYLVNFHYFSNNKTCKFVK